jgi:hypothetical protein
MLYALQAGQLIVVAVQVCQQPAAGNAFYAGQLVSKDVQHLQITHMTPVASGRAVSTAHCCTSW